MNTTLQGPRGLRITLDLKVRFAVEGVWGP